MDTSLAPFGASIEEDMLVQTFGNPGSHSKAIVVQGVAPDNATLKLSYLLAHTSNWGVIEHSRILTHELSIAYGHTLVTPSLRGWEAFPTPKALTHTRITRALSPIGATSPGCYFGVPLVPMVFRALLMERCTTRWVRNVMWSGIFIAWSSKLRACESTIYEE